MKRTERLENLRRIEDRVNEGEKITDFEIQIVDWDKVIKEHKERLELEVITKKEKLEKKAKKEKHFELYRECKQFLEHNDKNWENRKIERELEMKRKERIHLGEAKKEIIKEKVKKRKLEEEIDTKLKQLPNTEKEKLEREEKIQQRLDLIDTKKSLWKLRNK